MANQVRVRTKLSYLQYSKECAVGYRPLVTEDNMLNLLNLKEKYRYLVRVYIRVLEAIYCQGAPRRPSNDYLGEKLGRSPRQIQRYIREFRRLGLLKITEIHYPGCMKRGKFVPRNTYRYLTPKFKFGVVRKSNNSYSQEEWHNFLKKVSAYEKTTDIYRHSGRVVLLSGGTHLIKSLRSDTIIRQRDDCDMVFNGWWTLSDGKVVHFETWNGQ